MPLNLQKAHAGPTEVIEVELTVYYIDYFGTVCSSMTDVLTGYRGKTNLHAEIYHLAPGTTAAARKHPHQDGHGYSITCFRAYTYNKSLGRWDCSGVYHMEEIIVTPEDDDDDDDNSGSNSDPG